MASVTLSEIEADDYAKLVLPQTAPLWADGRDFPTYVAQTAELAGSRYGRRHYRTFGLFDGTSLTASFKRYDRTAHLGSARLRACGIGAVFTPASHRGRGYASVMLGTALDAARDAGYDAAFLFSDIAPQFYEALGFVTLPSREFALRADALPSQRLAPDTLRERDWSGVHRCYAIGERLRPAGFGRTALTWEYVRLRRQQIAATGAGRPTNLVLRIGRGVAAYVLGSRIPERDTYAVDEFGYAGAEAAQAIPALLRAGAGDLRRIAGWLPPAGARELLPRGSIRKRKRAIFMAAPLSPRGNRFIGALAQTGSADSCWHADHV